MEGLLYLVFVLLGCFLFFKPDTLWKIEHILMANEEGPTSTYILLCKVCGVALVLYAVVKTVMMLL